MLFRNLMAMDVEESIRAYPFDAVVLIAGCDKTEPAQLMGAASADVPAIMLTGGPAEPALFRGRELSVGTDLWRYTDELRAGRITIATTTSSRPPGSLAPGTATRWGRPRRWRRVTEALGMALPGSATIPALDARRAATAEAAGRRAVELAREDLRPSADPDAGRVRQRDHGAVRDRRLDERRRPPARARPARPATSSRSSGSTRSRADAGARRRAAGRRPPPRAARRAPAACPRSSTRSATCSTATARRSPAARSARRREPGHRSGGAAARRAAQAGRRSRRPARQRSRRAAPC